MELRGRLHNVTTDVMTGARYLALDIGPIPSGIGSLHGKDLDIVLKPHREKRSLNANAYYWTLVEKISDVLGASRPFVHNWLLRDHGTLEVVAGHNVPVWLPDTAEAHALALESEDYHLLPTSKRKMINGEPFREFLQIKGSRRYNTQEMSVLINGAVSEAESMDIETLPPAELERMMKLYEEHYTDER